VRLACFHEKALRVNWGFLRPRPGSPASIRTRFDPVVGRVPYEFRSQGCCQLRFGLGSSEQLA